MTKSTSLLQLQALLRDLFQLDLSDLDFGLYRVLRRKRDDIEAFLNEQLPRRVQEAFQGAAAGERDALEERRLAQEKKIRDNLGDEAIRDGEVNPGFAGTPLAKEYEMIRSQLADVRASEAQQAEVFNHLYNFFSRYYDAGDFMPRRRYGTSREHFAVPYNGEETFFHWANRDQHYVKSGELFRDYAFVADGGLEGEFRVRFVLRQATVAPGNTKGDTRFFFPVPEEAEWKVEERAFVLPFHYRLPTREEQTRFGKNGKAQDAILAEALPRILNAVPDEALRGALQAAPEAAEDAESGPPYLLRRLRHFTRRSTSDYFVHRNLRRFLERELEFYIKDQVLHVGDLEADLPAKLRVLRTVRRLAGELTEFLAQLEEVQRRLFEKRKLVLRTDWLVLIKDVPRPLWREVLGNEAQVDAWRDLFAIDPAKDLFNPGGEVNERFLEEHPTLVVDTRHFGGGDFVDRLFEGFEGSIDEATGGVLIQSENYQALRLLQRRYAGQVNCIYIDPPYNTGSDLFIYKDRYQHSSWLTMMEERLRLARGLMSDDAAIFVSIDDKEQANLKRLQDEVFGVGNFIDTIIWQKVYSPKSTAKHLSADHDFILVHARSADMWRPSLLPRTAEADARYRKGDDDGQDPWKPSDLSARNYYSKGEYTVVSPSGKEFSNPPGTYWRVSYEKFQELDRAGRIWWGDDGNNMPALKRFLSEVKQGIVPQTLWGYKDVGHTQEAKQELLGIVRFETTEDVLNTVKPTRLIRRVLQIDTVAYADQIVVDFFGGSGTTADAVIRQNREDGGSRKFVLIEMGQYFEDTVMQRVARILYAPEWKDLAPTRTPTADEVARTPRLVKVLRLESYEDALHNLSSAETVRRVEPREDAYRQAVGEDAYRLRYLARLPMEVSASLLQMDRVDHPFDYTIETLGENGPQVEPVDLVETFNLVYGLRVERQERWTNPADGRLYRTVQGRDRDDRRVLVVWRDVAGLDTARERTWLEARLAETGPWDEVLCNGDSGTPGVRSLDPDFKRLVAEPEEGL